MLEFFSHNKVQEKVIYSTNDFIFRWKKLERVVAKENLDGLLLVAGLDGKESAETVKLFNWLFLGLSGKGVYVNKYLDEVYSQMIVLVSKQGSSVFVTPKARQLLEGLIYAIPNSQVFSPTDEQYANKDKLDVAKISRFYAMVKKQKRIGVLLDEGQTIKDVQKWPIIQSYAIEQVGGTFFTIKFQVADLAARIQPLYRNHDKYSLQVLVEQNAKRIAGHIFGSTRAIEYADFNERQQITETKLNEPLKDVVEIMEIEQSNSSKEVRSRVIIGQRTANPNNLPQEDSKIGDNFHFTIDYWDPATELRVCRTYFLGNNTEHERIFEQTSVTHPESLIVTPLYRLEDHPNSRYADEQLLIHLYVTLIQATLESIMLVSKDYRNLNLEFIHNHTYSKIRPLVSTIYGSEKITPTDLKIQLLSFNALGQPQKIDFKDIVSFKLTPHFHIVRAHLGNIFSAKEPTKLLGGLLFSESFILQQGCYLLITKEVPYFNFWNCSKSTNSLLKAVRKDIEFQRLGAIVTDKLQNNRIIMPVEKLSFSGINIPVLKASYYFHKEGIRIHDQRMGWWVLFYDDIKNATMLNRVDSQWLIFNTDGNLIFGALGRKPIIMEFKGKAFECLMDRVNSKDNPLVVTFINEVPPIINDTPFLSRELQGRKTVSNPIHQLQIVDNAFLLNYLEAKQLMILNNMKDLKLASYRHLIKAEPQECPPDKHQLILINGPCGSGKNRTAQYLARYGKDYKLSLHVFKVDTSSLYDRIEIPALKQMIEEFIAERNLQKGSKDVTMVVVPSWLNCKELLETLSQAYHIRTVITKVNASNFYATKNYQLVDCVLAYATPGYSQSVILDTFMEEEQMVSHIRNVLWRYSSTSKIYRIVNNSIMTGVAKDILTNDKFTSEIEAFNRQKYAIFYDFGDMSRYHIKFFPLRLLVSPRQGFQRLAQQNNYVYDQSVLEERFQKEKEEAEKSKDDLLRVLYSIKENIAKMDLEANSMRLRYAKGHLKLIGGGVVEVVAANQFYKEKETKEKVEDIGLHIIATNFNDFEFGKFIESITEKKSIMSKMVKLRELSSVTKEEKKKIERSNLDRFLDNGEFFDGYFFRDAQGNVLHNHPGIDKLLDEYLEAENSKIREFNEGVKQEWADYQRRFDEA